MCLGKNCCLFKDREKLVNELCESNEGVVNVLQRVASLLNMALRRASYTEQVVFMLLATSSGCMYCEKETELRKATVSKLEM